MAKAAALVGNAMLGYVAADGTGQAFAIGQAGTSSENVRMSTRGARQVPGFATEGPAGCSLSTRAALTAAGLVAAAGVRRTSRRGAGAEPAAVVGLSSSLPAQSEYLRAKSHRFSFIPVMAYSTERAEKGPLRLAIVGAGPIGLELALGAVRRGIEVEIFERAKTVAGHVDDYRFVHLFSQWKLNMTEEGKSVLRDMGLAVPDEEAYPTGGELAEAYLLPLAKAIQENSHCTGLHLSSEVLAVGRGALLKSESIGGGEVQMPSGKPLCKQQRVDTPFRLLVRNVDTEEESYCEDFDVVADCSGFYRSDLANWLGKGGTPALGERALRSKGRLWTTIPDVLGSDRERFVGKRCMVVGAGMSAATTVRDVLELAKASSGTEVVYVTRSAEEPYTVIVDDVLPQRKALCELGNSAARGEISGLTYIGGSAICKLQETEDGKLRVVLQTPDSEAVELVDEIISCVGYHPDTSIYEELQVHQCYASNGPIKLAATLIGGSGDCLKQVSAGADTLKNPEPGFFILGSKSYGRKSSFLLKIGHEQVRMVLDSLAAASGA